MISNITIIKITPQDEQRWNKLLFNAINASYRQSIPFEYAKMDNGREIETFIFNYNGQDIAGVHYSIKRSLGGFISTANILSGFISREKPKQEFLAF